MIIIIIIIMSVNKLEEEENADLLWPLTKVFILRISLWSEES